MNNYRILIVGFLKKHWLKIILVVGLVITNLVTFFVVSKSQFKNESNQSFPTNKTVAKQTSNDPFDLRNVWSRGRCEGEGMVQFGTLPMREEDFEMYLPYGIVIDAHVTPIDHGYFSPTSYNSPRDAYEVRAIAEGVIVQIGIRDKEVNDTNNNRKKEPEYRLEIEHTCDLYSYFDLITSLAPDIKAQLDGSGGRNFSGRIKVKEGQLIGRIGGQTLDFAVYNNTLKLNFINPKHYERESWKIHTDDPYKYFKEPAKSLLISKSIRKASPIAGKIDYDIDGKLVGNWFQEGTNGYEGANQERYWDGHLAIVYDYLDPTQIRFSIGNFNGKASQFGVKGNSPDPATVDQSSSLVKYELVEFDYYNKTTGQSWRPMTIIDNPGTKNTDYVKGTALMQLMGDRKLKLEVFPGKTASQVGGFTSNAKVYER